MMTQSLKDYENWRDGMYDHDPDVDTWDVVEVQPLIWTPIGTEKIDWLYSGNKQEDNMRRCIGHLRIDFGSSGTEFWTTWFLHRRELITQDFKDELQVVVNDLQERDRLLADYRTMCRLFIAGTRVEESYGFCADSEQHEYCLRCIPMRGGYHAYLYCYQM